MERNKYGKTYVILLKLKYLSPFVFWFPSPWKLCRPIDFLQLFCMHVTFILLVFITTNHNLPSGLCESYGKGRYWTKGCRLTRDYQDSPLASGHTLRDHAKAIMKKPVDSFLTTMDETLHRTIIT